MTDPWSALRINVARLRQRDNLHELKRRSQNDTSQAFDVQVVANDLEITTARIPEGSVVSVQGAVETTLSGVEARARVSSSWEGECRRCLELVTGPIELDLVVPFIPDAEDSGDAEAYPFDGDWVDVGEVVREELMLALPLSPLCSDDCAGVEGELTPAGDEPAVEDEDEGETLDPRWAALSELTFDED